MGLHCCYFKSCYFKSFLSIYLKGQLHWVSTCFLWFWFGEYQSMWVEQLWNNYAPVPLTPQTWSMPKHHPECNFQSIIGHCESLFFIFWDVRLRFKLSYFFFFLTWMVWDAICVKCWAIMIGVAWCGIERGSSEDKQFRERGVEIPTASLRSYGLVSACIYELY